MEKALFTSLYSEYFYFFLSALLKPSRVLNARTPSGAQLWCYHIVPVKKPDPWRGLISFQWIKDVLQKNSLIRSRQRQLWKLCLLPIKLPAPLPGTEGKTCLQTPGHEFASCFSSAAPWACKIAEKWPEYRLHPKPGCSLIYFLGFPPFPAAAHWSELGCRLPLFFMPTQQGPNHTLRRDLARGKPNLKPHPIAQLSSQF